MDPRKTNARRGYAEREQKRKLAREQAASEWQYVTQEGKMNTNERKFPWWVLIVLGVLVLSSCCCISGISGILFPRQAAPVAQETEAPVIPTKAPVVVEPTPAPVIPTEDPVVEPTQASVTPVSCETIEVSKDGGNTWTSAGLALETESVYDIGNRVTWTSRSFLVDKAPDVELTDAELKIVENTWLKVRLNACNTNVVVFTHGIKIDDLKFDKGALFDLGDGYQEFDIRNGEVILWFDIQHQDKDLLRIVKEIRNGNFDIKSRLGLAVTDSLKDKLPEDILVGVQIVLLPK